MLGWGRVVKRGRVRGGGFIEDWKRERGGQGGGFLQLWF